MTRHLPLTLLLACGTTVPSAHAPNDISCPTPPSQPTLCIAPSTNTPYVVALPHGHAWRRNDWIVLSHSTTPIALASLRNPYPDAAEVFVLFQRPGSSLNGSSARLLAPNETLKLQHFAATIDHEKAGLVRLNIGQRDGARPGDLYSVYEPQHAFPTGRIQISQTHPGHAWAKILDWRQPLRPGMIALLEISGAGQILPVSIAIIDFLPEYPQHPHESKAAQALARDLADALASHAESLPLISVRYQPNAPLQSQLPDEQNHARAAAFGKEIGADLVVWGYLRLHNQNLAFPRLTWVNHQTLLNALPAGAPLLVERSDAGLRLKGNAPAEPVLLAAVLVGHAFFRAQQFKPLTLYLEPALERNLLSGQEKLKTRAELAHARMIMGHTVKAREQANILFVESKAQAEPAFGARAYLVLAQLNAREAKPAEAKAAYGEALKLAQAAKDQGLEAQALRGLGRIARQEGMSKEAMEFYAKALELSRKMGDREGEIWASYEQAAANTQPGKAEEQELLRILEPARNRGDRQAEAALRVELGGMALREGRMEEARSSLNRALELMRGIGDAWGEADALERLAMMEERLGQMAEASEHRARALELRQDGVRLEP